MDRTVNRMAVSGLISLSLLSSISASAAVAQDEPTPDASPGMTPAAADVEAIAGSEVSSIPLPTVDGLEWERDGEGYGATATDSEYAPIGLDVFIDALEADIADFGFRVVDARDADTNELVGAYLALRLSGQNRERMEEAALAWIASLLGVAEAPLAESSLAERGALAVELPDGSSSIYLIAEDDIVHLVSTATEDVAARVFDALR